MESALVKDNPLLLPLNKEKTIYDGFITVKVTCVASLDETTFEQRFHRGRKLHSKICQFNDNLLWSILYA